MNRLKEVLESLTLDDGSPNYNARKVELNTLVQYLTEAEVQDLRLQLNSRSIPNDLCSKFPVEIVQEIAKHLDLEEVIRARHVSKSWLDVIGGCETSLKMLKFHFPLVWEREFKHLSRAEQLSDKMSPQRALLTHSEKLARRKRGLYLSTTTYQLPTALHNFQYCNGRIAFQQSTWDPIHVWSLLSNARKSYVDENRESLYPWKLSDSLLICQKRRPFRFVVWDLDLPESAEPMNIHLPGRVRSFSAYQDQVAIVTNNLELMFWKWGGPLKRIDMHGLSVTLSPLAYMHVFFHPHDAGKIFMITKIDKKEPTEQYKTAIYEYTLVNNAWEWRLICPVAQRACLHRVHEPKLVQSEKGEIGIFSVITVPSYESSHHECSNLETGQTSRYQGAPDVSVCEYIIFNMLTGALEKYTYQIPEWYRRHSISTVRYCQNDMLIWRDQLLLPIRKANIVGDENTGAGLIALSSLPNSGSLPSSWNIRTVPKSENGNELITGWAGRTFIASRETDESDNQPSLPISVKGDEDFVVLFRGDEFVVWCFDKTITLPQYPTPG